MIPWQSAEAVASDLIGEVLAPIHASPLQAISIQRRADHILCWAVADQEAVAED